MRKVETTDSTEDTGTKRTVRKHFMYAAGLYREGEPLQTTLVTVPIAEERESKEDIAQRAIPFTGVALSLQE